MVECLGNAPTQVISPEVPQGGSYPVGAEFFAIDYAAGVGGNDVVLKHAAAPVVNIASVGTQNGNILLGGTGVPGVTYVLESTTDLTPPVVWKTVATSTADAAGAYQFFDPIIAAQPAYFYRVRSTP